MAQNEVIASLHEFKAMLETFNFAQQPPLEAATLSLFEWSFQSFQDWRNRAMQYPVFERMLPTLNAMLVVFDDFLETAHLTADGELAEAINEFESADYRHYDDINNLHAL